MSTPSSQNMTWQKSALLLPRLIKQSYWELWMVSILLGLISAINVRFTFTCNLIICPNSAHPCKLHFVIMFLLHCCIPSSAWLVQHMALFLNLQLTWLAESCSRIWLPLTNPYYLSRKSFMAKVKQFRMQRACMSEMKHLCSGSAHPCAWFNAYLRLSLLLCLYFPYWPPSRSIIGLSWPLVSVYIVHRSKLAILCLDRAMAKRLSLVLSGWSHPIPRAIVN